MKTHFVQAGAALMVALGMLLFIPAGAGAVGVGKTCDGIAAIRCDKGLWCEHKTGTCGGADISGKCVKIPQLCNQAIFPVCGCNNKTYSNDCKRRMAMVQKKADGSCKKK
jgi:Kazal-type serine protease inhibitor domain